MTVLRWGARDFFKAAATRPMLVSAAARTLRELSVATRPNTSALHRRNACVLSALSPARPRHTTSALLPHDATTRRAGPLARTSAVRAAPAPRRPTR
jgi:hypothetical protein